MESYLNQIQALTSKHANMEQIKQENQQLSTEILQSQLLI